MPEAIHREFIGITDQALAALHQCTGIKYQEVKRQPSKVYSQAELVYIYVFTSTRRSVAKSPAAGKTSRWIPHSRRW